MPQDALEDTAVEATPLLGGVPDAILNERQNGEHDRSSSNGKPAQVRASRFQVRRPRAIVLTTALLKFILTCSGSMILLPIFRLLEDAFCHEFYGDDSPGMIDERKCKVDEVQRRLAYLGGWVAMMSAVVGTHFDFDYMLCYWREILIVLQG